MENCFEISPEFTNYFSEELKNIFNNLRIRAYRSQIKIVNTLDLLEAMFVTEGTLVAEFLSEFNLVFDNCIQNFGLENLENFSQVDISISLNQNLQELIVLSIFELKFTNNYIKECELLNSEHVLLAMLSKRYFWAYSKLHSYGLDYSKAKKYYNNKYLIDNKIYLPLNNGIITELYKYIQPSLDVVKNICINGKIKYCLANQLNDKLEMKVRINHLIDFHKLFKNNYSDVKKSYENEVDDVYNLFGLDKEIDKKLFTDLMNNLFNEIIDKVPLFLQDTCDNITKNLMDNALEKHLNQYSVLSFTTKIDSQPMWAHYAANHSGLAIEFDIENDYFYSENPNTQLSPVLYTEQLQKFDDLLEPLKYHNSLLHNVCFFQKTNNWEYENEWRIVKNIETLEQQKYSEQDIYLDQVPTTLIKGIIFGIETKDDFKKKCIELLKINEKSKHIKFYNSFINKETLVYERKEIE